MFSHLLAISLIFCLLLFKLASKLTNLPGNLKKNSSSLLWFNNSLKFSRAVSKSIFSKISHKIQNSTFVKYLQFNIFSLGINILGYWIANLSESVRKISDIGIVPQPTDN